MLSPRKLWLNTIPTSIKIFEEPGNQGTDYEEEDIKKRVNVLKNGSIIMNSEMEDDMYTAEKEGSYFEN